MNEEPILKVDGLKKHFVQNTGIVDRLFGSTKVVKAVDGVSFEVTEGEILGLVGESGSGKSTVGKSILRLHEPTAGTVQFKGDSVTEMNDRELKAFRKEAQIIFQDPASSLNRRKTAAQIIKDPMEIHGLYKGERDEKVSELMDRVGLSPQYADHYPHEFSGGQRQRIGIARALAVEPDFIVADEPVSALDVSIQAQVLNLLKDIQEEFGLTVIFIAHNLGVIRHICDRVGVMYLGRIVEMAENDRLFNYPQHPYTQELLKSIPEADPRLRGERKTIEGEIPSPMNPPQGCSFHPRCPDATEECTEIDPALEQIADADRPHEAACIHVESFSEKSIARRPDETEDLHERYRVSSFKKQDPIRKEI